MQRSVARRAHVAPTAHLPHCTAACGIADGQRAAITQAQFVRWQCVRAMRQTVHLAFVGRRSRGDASRGCYCGSAVRNTCETWRLCCAQRWGATLRAQRGGMRGPPVVRTAALLGYLFGFVNVGDPVGDHMRRAWLAICER